MVVGRLAETYIVAFYLCIYLCMYLFVYLFKLISSRILLRRKTEQLQDEDKGLLTLAVLLRHRFGKVHPAVFQVIMKASLNACLRTSIFVKERKIYRQALTARQGQMQMCSVPFSPQGCTVRVDLDPFSGCPSGHTPHCCFFSGCTYLDTLK